MIDAPPNVSAPNSGVPDWSVIDETILCAMCDYDLRGLVEPRCPECGHRFDWEKLLEAIRSGAPDGFEHARSPGLRVFVLTSLASWIPWQFWNQLQPQHRIQRGRLIGYWLITVFLYFLSSATLLLWQQFPALVRPVVLPIVLSGVLYACWPWLTYATLRVFSQSMLRLQINTAHIFRCAIYSADFGFILGLLVTGLALLQGARMKDVTLRFIELNFDATTGPLVRVTTFVAVFTAWRLAWAYKRYMRFDHPIATAIASQVIVWLIATAVICWAIL